MPCVIKCVQSNTRSKKADRDVRVCIYSLFVFKLIGAEPTPVIKGDFKCVGFLSRRRRGLTFGMRGLHAGSSRVFLLKVALVRVCPPVSPRGTRLGRVGSRRKLCDTEDTHMLATVSGDAVYS